MALGSHLITVRRLEKYINDVIGKKANLPDTSKTIVGNISQINSDLESVNVTNRLSLGALSPSVYSNLSVETATYYPSCDLLYLHLKITMVSNSQIEAGKSRILTLSGVDYALGSISGSTVVNTTSDNNNQYGLIADFIPNNNKIVLTPKANTFSGGYSCDLYGLLHARIIL